MRKSALSLVAVLLCGFAPAGQAREQSAVPRVAALASQTAPKQLAEVKVVLSQAPLTDTRSQIAVCANFAAIRALMAKASGSDFGIQNRVLNLTFLLCMHGTSESD